MSEQGVADCAFQMRNGVNYFVNSFFYKIYTLILFYELERYREALSTQQKMFAWVLLHYFVNSFFYYNDSFSIMERHRETLSTQQKYLHRFD